MSRSKKYILLNNLESNHSLVIKLDQFYQKSTKNVAWKIVPGTFYIFRDSSGTNNLRKHAA